MRTKRKREKDEDLYQITVLSPPGRRKHRNDEKQTRETDTTNIKQKYFSSHGEKHN
jgi:hypothetical protein